MTDASPPPAIQADVRCPRCEKRSDMQIITPATPQQFSRFTRLLLQVFSPGGTDINQHYRCPRCGHKFKGMSLIEALLAPVAMVTLIIMSMLAFLWFVFFYVAPR